MPGYHVLSLFLSVTFATPSTITSLTYTYDAVGNRTQVTAGTTTAYTPNQLNQYASVGSLNFGYDLQGNLTNDTIRTYTYDAENRLITAQGSGLGAQYTYDAFGRRIQKTVNGQTTRFLYDGDQLLAETNQAGVITAKYAYGPGIDEVLRMTRGTQTSYYHADGLGSIIALTDSTGTPTLLARYDIYGQPFLQIPNSKPVAPSGTAFGFTGREYDSETGLYYFRARYYSPTIGRFLQRDPINLAYVQIPANHLSKIQRFMRKRYPLSHLLPIAPTQRVLQEILQGDPGLLNLYPYVGNNPVNRVDPDGELSMTTVYLLIILGILVANFGKWIYENLFIEAPLHVIEGEFEEMDPHIAEKKDELKKLYEELDTLCPIPQGSTNN